MAKTLKQLQEEAKRKLKPQRVLDFEAKLAEVNKITDTKIRDRRKSDLLNKEFPGKDLVGNTEYSPISTRTKTTGTSPDPVPERRFMFDGQTCVLGGSDAPYSSFQECIAANRQKMEENEQKKIAEQEAQMKKEEELKRFQEQQRVERLDLEAKLNEAEQNKRMAQAAEKERLKRDAQATAISGISSGVSSPQTAIAATQELTDTQQIQNRELDQLVKRIEIVRRAANEAEAAGLIDKKRELDEELIILEDEKIKKDKAALELDILEKESKTAAQKAADEALKTLFDDEFLASTDVDTLTSIYNKYADSTVPLSFYTGKQTLLKNLQEAIKSKDEDKITKAKKALGRLAEEEANKETVAMQDFKFYQELLKSDPDAAAKFATLKKIVPLKDIKKTSDDNILVTDPVTGKTTVVRTNPDGTIAGPKIADIGSGTVTLEYGKPTANLEDNKDLQSGIKGTPGIDIDGNTGDPILAFVEGEITQVATNGGYGNQVIITDSQGNEHMYSHLRDLNVPLQVGSKVRAGDVIGYMGNTGSVFGLGPNGEAIPVVEGDTETGSHLDYRVRTKEIINGSRWANPRDFISKELSNIQELQAVAIAKKYGGGKAAVETRITGIARKLFQEGKTLDDINDIMRDAEFSSATTGIWRDAIENVSLKLNSAVNKEDFKNEMDRSLQEGNIQRVKEQLKASAREGALATPKNKVEGQERTVDFIKEIANDLSELEKSGFNTNLLSGTEEEVAAALGTVKNAKLREVATKIDVAVQGYRQSLSGAQFSAQEAAEYRKIFPDIDKTAALNSANIRAVLSKFEGDIDKFYEQTIGETEYRKIFKEPFTEESINKSKQKFEANKPVRNNQEAYDLVEGVNNGTKISKDERSEIDNEWGDTINN